MERLIHIKDDFTVEGLTEFLIKTYHMKGYSVIVHKIGNSTQLEISKNTYGLLSFVGLSESVRVTYSVNSPSLLSVVFSDEKWTDKIIVMVIGLMCSCGVLSVIAGVGMFNQYMLSKNIHENINIFSISN